MMIRKLATIIILLVSAGFSTQPLAVESLRGQVALDAPSTMPTVKHFPKDGEPLARDYVQQPPLIPHKIEQYTINLKSNKCLTCHSWKHYRQYGATKISQTHFEDRDFSVLANVSARRYFCTQCHVPQAIARSLVGNDFRPLVGVVGE